MQRQVVIRLDILAVWIFNFNWSWGKQSEAQTCSFFWKNVTMTLLGIFLRMRRQNEQNKLKIPVCSFAHLRLQTHCKKECRFERNVFPCILVVGVTIALTVCPGVNFTSQSCPQLKNMEKSFNLSSDKFCQVEFSSELLPQEMDPCSTFYS